MFNSAGRNSGSGGRNFVLPKQLSAEAKENAAKL